MGELKQLSEEQTKLVERVKSFANQLYLANLGLVAKAEEEGQKQLDKLLSAGEKARGEQAADTSKPLLAAYGLVDVLKEEGQKLKEEGVNTEALKAQFEELKQKLSALNVKEEGLKLKEESQKLFDELVAAGEKRKAV